jgi:hypothetical protein
MSRDELVFVALVLAFAAFITSHVALCFGIASKRPRVRALVAFVVVPLAPVWGVKDRLTTRVTLWIVFALSYVVLRVIARR